MAANQELGQKGESLARRYLETKGYRIEAVNWRFSRAEIDIVAKKGDLLVFVEVKTRESFHSFFGRPEDAVNYKKIKHLAEAAAAYMREFNHQWAIRFDIIGILLPSKGHVQIRHLEDAFFPGLQTG